jgi:uncharacterized delta-60 repeat protein
MKHLLGFPIALLLMLTATARGQSALDGFDPNANEEIRVVAVQSDGKILIGGGFTTLAPNGAAPVTRNHIARLNPDGSLDPMFNPNADGWIASIVVQTDGKILLSGFFENIAGQPRQYIARLHADGTLDSTFDPNANSFVVAVALQADGKILVGGYFGTIGGQSRRYVARLDATTGLADSFNPMGAAGNVVRSLAVQADGKILVGGDFELGIGGQPRGHIARLDPITGLADSFNPNANGEVDSISIQGDGKILVAGNFGTIGGQSRLNIARLEPATGLADSWDPHSDSLVYAIAIQADGKILVGGHFLNMGGQERYHIARLDPTTGLADSFDPHPQNEVYALAVQSDGKVLASGSFDNFWQNGEIVTRNRIARLETDGRLDRTLDFGIQTTVSFDGTLTSAVEPDGKILLGGRFSRVQGITRNNIARFNTDGTLDMAFNPNANAQVNAIAVQADGKILVGGEFTTLGGQPRSLIARLDPVTGLADSFNPNATGGPGFPNVGSITVQADDKILVTGNFTSIGGQARNHIARLDPTSGLADSFNPNAGGLPFPSVSSIAVQTDGKILVCGGFTIIGGQPRNYLARLDAGTGLADSFNANADGSVYHIAVQSDGKILVGGYFQHIGGQARNFMARLEPTNGSADSFNPNPSTPISAITLQGDGKIFVGGSFNSVGGQMRNRIARLDAATGLADSYDPNANAHTDVVTITPQVDGKIIVSGFLESVGGQPRSRSARLSNDIPALQDLGVTETTITWTRGGSCPRFWRVTFEFSNDNSSYTPLGNGVAAGNNWILTGLSLPSGQNIYIRARGYYYSGGSQSIAESVKYGPPGLPEPSKLGNISTRVRVLSDDNALIGGMIATGTAPKRVIIRAIGPSLTSFGVPGALQNPTLDLFQGTTLLFSNDDWNNSTQQSEIAASGLAPSNDLESAIIWTLTPGQNYTAVVRGINNTTGVGVVEAFDLNQAAASKLGNISTRGFVDVDDNVMIAGLIVSPSNGTSTNVLVRALGPTLGDFGVPGFLANPTLDLVNSSGTVIRSDDNWKDDPQQRALIEAAGLAPNHDEEAALVETVAPGAYTAIVRGTNRATGVGLVETYNIP